jgi:hypothetical protein
MIGKWQSKEFPEIDLEVREGNDFVEYLAHGHIYVCNSSDCLFCGVDFQLHAASDDRYEMRGNGDEHCGNKSRWGGITAC